MLLIDPMSIGVPSQLNVEEAANPGGAGYAITVLISGGVIVIF
jgi:hypothetical protein